MFEERKVAVGLVAGTLGGVLGGVAWRKWRDVRRSRDRSNGGAVLEDAKGETVRGRLDARRLGGDEDGRTEAGEALRVSERRFRAVIEQSPLSVHIFTPEGRSLVSNAAWDELWNLKKGESPEGSNIFEDDQIVASGLVPYIEESIEGVLRVETPPLFYDPARTGREGRKRWLQAIVYPLVGEAGNLLEVVLVIEDITGRKEAAEELARSEERFRSMVQNASDIITILDSNGVVYYESPAIERVLGYAPEELVGEYIFGYIHPDDVEAVREVLAEIAWRGGPRAVEPRFRHADGSWRYMESIGGRLAGGGAGEAPDRVVVNSRDVTGRKLAEEDLRLKERAIDSSANGVIITGTVEEGTRALYVNPAVEGMTGYAAEEIVGHNPRFLQGADRDQLEGKKLHACIEEGREYFGVLRNYRKDGALFYNEMYVSPVRDEGGNITHFIGIQTDITERKNLEEQLTHQAFHDSLTGLPNRALFLDRLGHALEREKRGEEGVAIVFIDLDNFKYVNDSLGHEAGDTLLIAFADRLRRSLRPADTVARLGGDEFAVLLDDLEDPEQAAWVARRMAGECAEPFRVGEAGQEVFATASMGIALSPFEGYGDEGDLPSSVDLLRDADAAMYEAKRKGKNRYEVFEPGIGVRASERLSLESDLRRALAREEFRLHYQPKVLLKTGEVSGVEALVRWERPERGLVSPGEFIPLAEETGLVVPLGRWVILEACRQAKEWRERPRGPDPLTVWVNLSARQLRDAGLVGEIKSALKRTGLSPEGLGLEITESVLMEYGTGTVSALAGLKELGVKLAIDDFGTGYSSLSYLKRLPVDYLKIDRSFVDGLGKSTEDEVLVSAMIDLAQALGLRVVAEGVETAEQLERLAALDCDLAQGYHLSRPLPTEVATQFLFEES